MTSQPGLFDLPDPPPTPTVRAPRDRGRRGERWTDAAHVDVVQVQQLRQHHLRGSLSGGGGHLRRGRHQVEESPASAPTAS